MRRRIHTLPMLAESERALPVHPNWVAVDGIDMRPSDLLAAPRPGQEERQRMEGVSRPILSSHQSAPLGMPPAAPPVPFTSTARWRHCRCLAATGESPHVAINAHEVQLGSAAVTIAEALVGSPSELLADRMLQAVSYAAVGGPNQVASASGRPRWVPSPTQAT